MYTPPLVDLLNRSGPQAHCSNVFYRGVHVTRNLIKGTCLQIDQGSPWISMKTFEKVNQSIGPESVSLIFGCPVLFCETLRFKQYYLIHGGLWWIHLMVCNRQTSCSCSVSSPEIIFSSKLLKSDQILLNSFFLSKSLPFCHFFWLYFLLSNHVHVQ